METKKIKEIKDYAKTDVKYFLKRVQECEESDKAGMPERGKEFLAKYPKGITSYYEQIFQENERPERKDKLIKRFGYTEETLKERAEIYHEAFWSSWKWWNNKLLEVKTTMAKYEPVFKAAEVFAKKIDVSDIRDGFPCGSATLYLDPEMKDSDLGKALRVINDCDSYTAKVCHWSAYKLPIRIPSHGQCMNFDERVCSEVKKFLDSKGIKVGVYPMID